MYLYWNRRTGKFRIGRIKYGEIGKGYVNAEHKYDGMSKNEIRVGLLHTHFWSIYSSFHDIAGVRKLVEQEIGNEHLKAFIAKVHVDQDGELHVELRMYDLLSIPLSEGEVKDKVNFERQRFNPGYPLSLFRHYSINIDKFGNESMIQSNGRSCNTVQ